MKNTIMQIFAILFVSVLLISGCRKSDNTSTQEYVAQNVSGNWTGYILDNSNNSQTVNDSYDLNITQNGSILSSTLTVPAKFGFLTPIAFTGKMENNTTFIMTGASDGADLKIHGALQDDDTLQLVIEGVEATPQFIFMYQEKPLLTSSLSNPYKLELKLGKIGRGRSVILVHGLHDNSESWNDMLKYFKDHGIGNTNNIWTFQYKWGKGIAENGREMAKEVLAKQKDNNITKDPIIIAHSMGGLVSRAYIAYGYNGQTTNFYKLVTLSTPHYGSKLGHFVSLTGDGIKDLKPGSKFLNDLNANTYEKKQRSKYWVLNGRIGVYKYKNKYHILCYHWYNPQPTFVEKRGHTILSNPNDGMVTNASARFDKTDDYAQDNSVHRVDTYKWIDHKRMNRDERISKYIVSFINRWK